MPLARTGKCVGWGKSAGTKVQGGEMCRDKSVGWGQSVGDTVSGEADCVRTNVWRDKMCKGKGVGQGKRDKSVE